MEIIYFTGVKLYSLLINIAAPFRHKASDWVKGRKNWKNRYGLILKPNEKRIWFHCSSLGEYEQGKPVIEAVRKNFPGHKIVLTFFSPSGYNIRKNDPLADYVFYLPADGPLNAPAFVKLINPSLAFFVKYEYWHYYIKALKNQKVPLYIVSAIFRPSQVFFKPYGKFFYDMLKRVSHFFVQNQSSLELLYNHSISQVSVTGDTRFDRVYQNSLTAAHYPEIELFRSGKQLLVAGSTWPADEKMLLELFRNQDESFRLIIAPHETTTSRINNLQSLFGNESIRYSQWDKKATSARVLIIDSIGMLSSVYRYGDAAYIGGGFGKGIHNILEAVVFGLPVFFGPRHARFREANDLVHWKGAFPFKKSEQLISEFREVMSSNERLARIRDINTRYIKNNMGSTDLIIDFLKINHPWLTEEQ